MARREQPDLFLDYGIKPGPVRVWFTASVEPYEDNMGNTRRFSVQIRYRPSSRRFTKEDSGARPSERRAMWAIECVIRANLGGMVFCMTDPELAALKSGIPGYYRQARTVFYSVELNGIEVVSRRQYVPGERFVDY